MKRWLRALAPNTAMVRLRRRAIVGVRTMRASPKRPTLKDSSDRPSQAAGPTNSAGSASGAGAINAATVPP